MKLDSFETRLLKLLSDSSLHPVFIYEKPDNSTFRYRVLHTIDHLESSNENIKATWFTILELLENSNLILAHAASIVFVRVPYYPELEIILKTANRMSIKTIFDADDLIFSSQYINQIMMSLRQDIRDSAIIDYWYSYVSRREKMALLCDEYSLSTTTLAAVASEIFDGKCNVVPNLLSQEDFCLADCDHMGLKRDPNYFTIVYMSGSPSHQKDFNFIKQDIGNFLELHPNSRLFVRGYPVDLWSLEKYSNRIVERPFVQPEKMSCTFRESDLAIAPLSPSIFTECKSNIKWLEAAAGGVPTLASRTTPYSQSIQDGTTGFVASGWEWSEKLKATYESSELLKISNNAFNSVMEKWHVDSKTSEHNLEFWAPALFHR
jgi:glycosyltransferase involved in cell wall biosynthesis